MPDDQRYKRAPQAIRDLAAAIICEYATHKPLADAKVRVDIILVFPAKDPDGNYTGHAMVSQGQRVLGRAKIISEENREGGQGDCKVLLDGEWWEEASEEDQKALLDHELHHFDVRKDADGKFLLDSLNRPKLRYRHHDIVIGGFSVIAARHGAHSQERQIAKTLMEHCQMTLWPDMVKMELAAAGSGAA